MVCKRKQDQVFLRIPPQLLFQRHHQLIHPLQFLEEPRDEFVVVEVDATVDLDH